VETLSIRGIPIVQSVTMVGLRSRIDILRFLGAKYIQVGEILLMTWRLQFVIMETDKLDQYYEITAFLNSRRKSLPDDEKYTMTTAEFLKAYVAYLEEELELRKEFIDCILE
jgi:hypothetical protein